MGPARQTSSIFLNFSLISPENSLLEAVGRSGGAGRIFRRDPLGSLTKKISFLVNGDGEYTDYRRRKSHRANYEFSADIQLSENNSAIYFNRQRLKLSILPDSKHERPQTIDIEVLAIADDQTKTIFHHLDKSAVSDAFSPHRGKELLPLDEIKTQIQGFCSGYFRNRALYQLLDRFVEGISLIARDLLGGQSFNISPAVVRTPEDIASEPEIAQDGRGLAAILFALTTARRADQLPYPYWGYRFQSVRKSRTDY